MNIQCPNCETVFDLQEKQKINNKYKCSVCSHIWLDIKYKPNQIDSAEKGNLKILFIINTAMAQEQKAKVLVLIYSDNGGTYELAKEIAKGIESGQNVQAIIKQVKAFENPKLKNIPVATVEELADYDGIAFSSPVYFGNISTGMSEFLSKTIGLWSSHALEGKPATVFMSAGSGAGKRIVTAFFIVCHPTLCKLLRTQL